MGVVGRLSKLEKQLKLALSITKGVWLIILSTKCAVLRGKVRQALFLLGGIGLNELLNLCIFLL